MIAIVLNVLYKMIVGFFAGKIIQKILKWENKKISLLPFGFFAYMGILLLISNLVVTIGISANLYLLICFGIGLAIVILAVILRCELLPTKYDIVGFVIGTLICAAFVWRVSSYNYGENGYDSTFYLSMVIEKSKYTSFNPHCGMDFYLGLEYDSFLPRYDYQVFYTLEAFFIKLFTRIGIYTNTLTTPIYTWGTTCSYAFMFGIMLTNIYYRFFEKKKLWGLFWLSMSIVVCVMYYTYVLAFFGNSWRTLCFSCFLYILYESYKDKNYDIKITVIMGILLNGSLAFSSSCAFIILFVLVSLLVNAIYFNNDTKLYKSILILIAFVFPYLAVQFWYTNQTMTILICIAFFAYVLIFYIVSKKDNRYKMFIKIQQYLIPLILIGVVILSYFIEKTSRWPYSFFFEAHSVGDMNYDFFRFFDNISTIYFTTIILWIVTILYFIFNKDNKDFKRLFIFMFIIFLNPLTLPFVIQYLSDFVYYRAYDAVFNMFTLAVFVDTVASLNNKKWAYCLSTVASIYMLYYGINDFIQYHSNALKPEEGYTFNGFYRLEEPKVEALEFFKNEVNGMGERPLVLTQITAIKGFVENCRLIYQAQDMSGLYKYDEDKPEASNELLNIFGLRDYAEQSLFSSDPNFDDANDLILSNNIQYLILDTKQFKVVNGEYIPIFFDIRAIADTLYINDHYVILKVRY